ncbi:MAG TPA: aminoacyl-tRNA hydrolase [Bryobacteraceae bacterium]|jgi:PTH1 family peptidyl-tRNA hydrolase|nr:aminoacyl-tRNA hydrolase [Bryobacteraceae bacterium]
MSIEIVPESAPAKESGEAAAYQAAELCIIGLGNPGIRFDETPHNLGFRVIDELAARHSIRILKNEGVARTGTGAIGNKTVALVKPQTFMNNSGRAVSAVLRARNLTTRNLILVHDELDLPWTGLRIKAKGSAAGHNGVKSIISAMKTDVFVRVRIGIRPDHPIEDAAEYVLTRFGQQMQDDVSEVVSYAADAIDAIVAEGAIRAMTKYNRRARGIKDEEE